MKKQKKAFKETRVGVFLKERAPTILNSVSELLPDQGGLGILKNMLEKDVAMHPKDREEAMKLLELDMYEAIAISERWKADMTADSWLSKNVRPMTLVFLTLVCTMLIVIDSFHTLFDVDTAWVDLLKTLLVTVYVAYFGSRGAEKVFHKSKKI
tara:strand:+ start:208 stop:669 length:462 start_codon:yes stop_codon:yes gene_type:complete